MTQADLHDVGSVVVDEDLLAREQAAIIDVTDVTDRARLGTYVLSSPRGCGLLGLNGAAVRLVHPGDLLILEAYGQMADVEAPTAGSSSWTGTTG